MIIETPKSITIDGAEYPLTQFSETVQRLVGIHTSWRGDLVDERLAVAKTEAAIRAVDAELAGLINAELNPATVPPTNDSEEAENEPEANS
jgi:hypothetical protein